MTSKMSINEIVNELLRLISLPDFKRPEREIDTVLPWLRKRSLLLQNLEQSVLQDIVKHCSLLSCSRDDIIIKQGDKGDSFYIILRGSVSVYIDPKMTGEGGEDAISRSSAKKSKKTKKKQKELETEDSVLSGMTKPESETTEDGHELEEGEDVIDEEYEDEDGRMKMIKKPTKVIAALDRNKFGKFIVNYGVGGSFGEVALVNKDMTRNATVITDEDTDFMVIDQDLFDRSLRAEQEAKYAEMRDFIEEHPFFKDMTTKFKKLLEMSLRKETYIFDTNIIKQGDPVVGLHFIISGNASVSIQPKKHQQQYPHLWPFEAGIDQLSIEFEHLRVARRAAILRKYEDPSVWETKPEELVIRREQGYAAIEKRMKENHINLCTVQTREVLGDVETLVNLSTYMQTVRCTSNTECFVLDTKNFERLVSKKNNPQTMDLMREYVKFKLHTRMNMRNADLIPFLGYLHQKLTEQMLPPIKKVEPFRVSKTVPDMDEEMQHLLQYFREGKEVVLIKPMVPGVVYYRELMREKAKAREVQRKGSKDGGIKLGSVTKSQPRRKPRSMLQIRESLRQMMEAEVIELETKKQRKRHKTIRPVSESPQLSHNSHMDKSPRTLIGDQNRNGRLSVDSHKTTGTSDTSPSPRDKNEKERVNTDIREILSFKDKQDLPKSTPPVFVTELSKNPLEPALPMIQEENSHDEITLPARSNRSKTNDNNHSNQTSRSSKEIKKKKSKKNGHVDTSVKQEVHSTPEKNNELPPIQTSISPRSPRDRNGETSRSSRDLNGVSDSNGVHEYNVPKLPALLNSTESTEGNHVDKGAVQTGGRTDERVVTDKWESTVSFVNQRVKDRLAKTLDEEESNDYETSEPSLMLLENRIQAFHLKYGMGSKTKNLPTLKRYKLDREEDYRPKPGGKVWVKKQVCRFSDSEYVVKDHKHVRYRMVDSIPEFDRVQKSKVVLQRILNSTEFSHS